MTRLRAITVCVDYADYASVTLPYNRHHFDDLLVVTCPGDRAVQLCEDLRIRCYTTNAFYAGGAVFNKWAALEEALDVYGRHGWLCILDADVLWPKNIRVVPGVAEEIYNQPGVVAQDSQLQIGKLYSPLRHMMTDTSKPIPPEEQWGQFPIHRNVGEWAGYTQVFHAADPHLPPPPWHSVDFIHAGAADSFFQNLWPPTDKVRFPWNCLHLGEAGQNWFGRSTPYLDGTQHPLAATRKTRIRELWRRRKQRPGSVYDQDRYKDEKIG